MAKLRELQVDYGRKTTFLRGNNQMHYRGVFVWIKTIVQYVVWFLLLPWTFFVTLFVKRTRHGMALECNESTKGGQLKQGGTSISGDNDDCDNYHCNEDCDKIIPYQSYRHNGSHVSQDMLTKTEPTNTPSTPFKLLLRLILLQSPCRVIYNPSRSYERIMSDLISLEDSGEFDVFDQYSSITLSRYASCNPEITAAVLIEQSRCMFYRDRLARAKSLAREALEVSTRTACPGMFIARACLVVSAIYRRRGKLGKAKTFLEKAEQNLTNTNYFEDWSRFYDAYGSYLNSFIDTVSNPSSELYRNANESFRKQLQAANRDSRTRVREKNRLFAVLKRARTLLDANTLFGQQREVPAHDIRVAAECLDEIENELCDDVDSFPRGTRLQFLLVRCKQYYREKRYQDMLPLLEKCINVAKSNGYERDLALILKGVQQVKVLAGIKEEISPVDPNTEGCGEKNSSFSSEKESDITDSIDTFGSELSN